MSLALERLLDCQTTPLTNLVKSVLALKTHTVRVDRVDNVYTVKISNKDYTFGVYGWEFMITALTRSPVTEHEAFIDEWECSEIRFFDKNRYRLKSTRVATEVLEDLNLHIPRKIKLKKKKLS